MSVLKKLKDGYRQFVHDIPGERFVNLHHRWHGKGRGPGTIIGFVTGIILIVVGILLGLVPGVPGIVLGFLGLGVIAAQSRLLAKKLDRAEVALRACLKIP